MKRYLMILLSIVIIAALCGCGAKGGNDGNAEGGSAAVVTDENGETVASDGTTADDGKSGKSDSSTLPRVGGEGDNEITVTIPDDAGTTQKSSGTTTTQKSETTTSDSDSSGRETPILPLG